MRRLSKGEVTLRTLERTSLPLDIALRNKKPTIVEFYANWCEVCRELTPEVYKVCNPPFQIDKCG